MISRLMIISLIIFTSSCNDDMEVDNTQSVDTIPPRITLNGPEVDTAYLLTYYDDKTASLLDNEHGLMHCVDKSGHMQTNGYVDTRIKGTYTISYKGTDMAGNESATLTRTVHVVPHPLEFLNGDYLVSYTCTAYYRGTSNSTVTTGNYRATVKPGPKNDHFELISLYVGPQYIVPQTYMEGDKMNVGFWYQDYQRADAKATLFPNKDGFCIQTQVYLHTPEYYTCVNVFKKQLIIKTIALK